MNQLYEKMCIKISLGKEGKVMVLNEPEYIPDALIVASQDPEHSVGASHRIQKTPCYSVFTPCDSVVNSLRLRG